MAREEVHCSYCSCVVVLWVAALHKGAQMKSVVTKSLANVWLQSTEMASQHRWQEVPRHRLAVSPAQVQWQQCASPVIRCSPKILLCFLDLFVNSYTYFVFTYMWAGKVIKGRYLFTFSLSSLVWFGTGAKGHASLWLKLGHRCCRTMGAWTKHWMILSEPLPVSLGYLYLGGNFATNLHSLWAAALPLTQHM